MRRIYASFGARSRDPCLAFWAGFRRMRVACGLDLTATPLDLIDALPPTDEAEAPPIVAADLPPPEAPDPTPRDRRRALTRLLLRRPRPRVIVFVPPPLRGLVRSLARQGVQEFVFMTEEDLPRAVQQSLSRVLLPWWISAFVEAFPARRLTFQEEVGLRAFLLALDGSDPEMALAKRWGGEVAVVNRRLASARLLPLREICTFGLLVHMAQEEKDSVGGGGAALRDLGLRWEDLRARCAPLVDEDPRTLVDRGDPEGVLKWLRRRLRDHARTGREEAAIPEEDEVRVALDRLYREHAAAMRRTLMAEGPDEDEAEDVVHEVFKSLVERRKCDVGRRYLAKAARLCMWRRRQAAGNREVSLAGKGDGWWSEGEALPKEKTEIDLELLRLVEDGIHQRPEPKRTIMRLTCAAGWSPSTVAELMGTTPSQVKSCRRRVVEELRETKAHAGQEHCREDTMGSPVRTGRDPFSGG